MTLLIVDSEEIAAFRAHVRAVISTRAPKWTAREGRRAPDSPEQEAELRHWYRTLYNEQVVGGGWPVEWGGAPDHLPLYDVVATEELIRARAPRPLDQVQLASHLLLNFGTDSQKCQLLPAIRSGQHIWCQLFSEPGAGSDLAGLSTRAEQTSSGTYVLTGQKTWTTDAHWADWGVALVRTGPFAQRHRSLTMFLVPMGVHGLTIRPVLTMGGAPEFNEVFLDEVELDGQHILGSPGQGWAIAMSGLEAERFGVGGNVAMLELLLDDVVECARRFGEPSSPPIVRASVQDRIIELSSSVEAVTAVVADYIESRSHGGTDDVDAATGKILYSETYGRIANFGLEMISEFASVEELNHLPSAQRLLDAWLWWRALTISGGSSEIMRNVIAKRGLSLPTPRLAST